VTHPAASESRAAARASVAYARIRPSDAHFNFAMVVQQDHNATRAGLASSERSSWSRAAAFRRGQLKISAPIPWSDAAGSNVMSTHSPDAAGYGQYARFSMQQETSDGNMPKSDRPDKAAPTLPVASSFNEPRQQRPKTSSPDMKASPRTQAPRDSIMYENFSSSESPKSTPSKGDAVGTKRRKSVVLRSVIRRMFGKKDKDEEKDPMLPSQTQTAANHTHQRSVGPCKCLTVVAHTDPLRTRLFFQRSYLRRKRKRRVKGLSTQIRIACCPCRIRRPNLIRSKIPFDHTCLSP